MVSQVKINDDNAETIGTPIFDSIIKSFVNSDREELLRHFPYLRDWMTVDIFDEADTALNRLGEVLSVTYSTHSIENDSHSLAWKVKYKNDEELVNWKLLLINYQDGIKVNGFAFDR